jgi:hypothetical protein
LERQEPTQIYWPLDGVEYFFVQVCLENMREGDGGMREGAGGKGK